MEKETKKGSIKLYGGALLLVIITFIYLVLFSPVSYEEKKTVVEIYYLDRIVEAHKTIIEKFNSIHKGEIKVIPVDLPVNKFTSNERKELLTRALRAKSGKIDVFAVDIIWTERFAKWSEPLDLYFQPADIEKYSDLMLETCYANDQLYSLPLNIVITAMYYREDLINNLPDSDLIKSQLEKDITWEDFIQLKEKVLPNDNSFYYFPAESFEGLICSYMSALLSNDKNYFKDNRMRFENPNDETNIKTLQFFVDMIHKYKTSPEEITKWDEVNNYQHFISEDGYFTWGWQTYLNDFTHLLDEPEKQKYLKRVSLPYFEQGKPTAVIGGWNVMLSKFSEHKKEAVTFLKYLTGIEAQGILHESAGYLPPLKIFYTSEDYLRRYPDIKENLRYLEQGVHRPPHPDYTRISEIMSHYIKKAMTKELSVKDALKEAEAAIKSQKVLIK